MDWQGPEGRQGQRVIVDLDLDERAGARLVEGKVVPRTRHARTRFVPVEIDIEIEGEAFLDVPHVGDPWEPVTVQARLERMGEAMGQLPRVRPQKVRSCMPEKVRERWKDVADDEEDEQAEDSRDDSGVKAAYQVIDALPAGGADMDPEADRVRRIAWAIAQKRSNRWLGRKEGIHHLTAGARKQEMLKTLAARWNALPWRPDAEDIRRARELLHPQKN